MASLWEQTKQFVNDGITLADASTNDFVDVLQETNPKIMDEVLTLDPSLDKDERGVLFMDHIITNPEFRQNFLDAKSAQPEAFKDLMGTLNLDAEQVNQQVALLDNSLVKNVLNNHPEAMKAVLNAEDGQHAEVFQEQLKDHSFRSTLVDATIASPQVLKDLVRDVPELNQNSQIQEMMPMLDNKFVMNIASNHRGMVNDLLNPDLQGQQQEIMSHYMGTPAVQATAAESVHLYREDAIAYQNSLETPDPELKRLIDLPPEVLTASMSAIQNGANPTQTLTQNAVNYEFDPILTLAKTDPEAAGQAFVDKMGEQMGHSGSAAVQANMLELKADPELMKAIGDDLAKYGTKIKGALPKLIEPDPTKIDNVAIANFGNTYPEMMQVGATLLAAHDPAEAAQTAMDGMRHNLISSIGGVDLAIKTATDAGVNTLNISDDLKLLQEADSVADLKGIKHIDISKLDQNDLLGSVSEINSIVDGLEATPAFMNGLGTRLADPALAQNLMNNLDSSSSGGLTSLKVVTDSLKEDPEGGLDILASEHFMGLAAERWGTDIMNANIDGFFTDMKTALADFATSDMGLMLKQQFGIDLSQMAGSLDGFAGMIKEQITPMISNMGADVANLQMGGGIVASINERLEPHGGSIGMNSAGGDLSGIVGGAQSHLANTQQYAANVEYAREMGLSGQELQDYIDDQVDDRFERELPIEKVVDATSGQVRERTPTELASAQNIENDHDAILAKSKLPGNEPGLEPVLAGG